MIHLEEAIRVLRGRMSTKRNMLENKRYKKYRKQIKQELSQMEHAVNILKKAEERGSK